jgi:hypothetical protein
MGELLTVSSAMVCPHGGSVSATSSNTRVKADGAYVLRPSDTFMIAGCSFAPSGPHPCVSVSWTTAALRGKAAGDFALTTDSVGLCLAADGAPQGTVSVVSAQLRARGQ